MTDFIVDDFVEVTEKDIPMIQRFIEKAQYQESNHNIINMFQWRLQYPLWQFHTEHYLLLLGVHKGHLFCYMPLCTDEYFREGMLKARSIFKANSIPFELSCFTQDKVEEVKHIFPHVLAHAEPEAADYIYEADKLRTLSGKKLQKRRNNYNNFLHTYEGRWIYEALSLENIKDVKSYLYGWKRNTTEEYLRYEIQGTDAILDLIGVLPYQGGVIRIDGEVKAFIIASQSTEDMAQINIEKADPEIRGLYQAIEKEFLERNYRNVSWINREDDMGNDSLRQAKMALNPSHMIEKYRIKEDR